MLSYSTINPHTLELLRLLTNDEVLAETRLVGGTSLALQYGHRNSVDLDFFGCIKVDDEELVARLKCYGTLQILKLAPNIKIFDLDGVKVDIVNYSYPWIDDVVIEDGLRLASPRDIAAMKINAIEGRGTKKDFIDVHELLKHYTLQELLSFYSAKYPEHSIFRALLSLSYFEDADVQPMPIMYVEEDWATIKNNISKHIHDYS